ncbi:MAG TPA: hypothetical protein VFB58_07235 [Chloroflexota bacterium]|nr:hypothetical protein [Chloroflexota bacterium]
MSTQSLIEVLRRAGDDPAYRQLLESDPDAALHGYDLMPNQRDALIAGDVAELEQMGVPPELSTAAGLYNREGERLT